MKIWGATEVGISTFPVHLRGENASKHGKLASSLTHKGRFRSIPAHLKRVLITDLIKSFASKNGNVYKKIMESVELKLREIDNGQFVVGYTKKIVEILGEPEMSLEVKAGQISEDVSRLVESLGYHVAAKKAMDSWIRLKAVKLNK